MKHLWQSLLAMLLLALLTACSVKYQFTGTSINYDLIKTIQIDKVANRAPYGWAPMEAMFNTKLQDQYANQTRLKLVKRGGDLHIAGEITGYDQLGKTVLRHHAVRLEPAADRRAGNPRDGNDKGPLRPDFQRHRGRLVTTATPAAPTARTVPSFSPHP